MPERHAFPAVVRDVESPQPLRPWALPLWFVAFAIAFVLTTRVFTPERTDDPLFEAKIESFLAHADEYDVVFFGTSRIHRGFDPDAFDEELAALGHEVRSFNFGIPHCRPHELDAVIERLLAERSGRVKYVFVELMDWFPTLLEGSEHHPRTVAWHTHRQTRSALETINRTDLPLLDDPDAERTLRRRGKFTLWSLHLGHWFQRWTNFGAGTQWLRELVDDGSTRAAWRRVVDSGRGQITFEQESAERYAINRREFLERYFSIFHEQVAGIDEANRRPGSLATFNVRAQLAQQARIRDRFGAVPVFVVPNVRWGTPEFRLLADAGLENVLSFNHVARYPELYDADHYHDRGHLNAEGARLFSRHLARRFAAWLETR